MVKAANRSLDNIVNGANSQGDTRFYVVDVSSMLSRYDYKTCYFEKQKGCDKKQEVVTKEMSGVDRIYRFDNRPLRASGNSAVQTGRNFAANITAGGLFSFDNMHLSSIGYELMARAVVKEMENRGNIPKIDKAANTRCDNKNAKPPKPTLQHGDCRYLLTEPGWSVADATRRDYAFQRIAGDDEMKNATFLRALLAFGQ